MTKRFVLVSLFIGVLVALVYYSKWSAEPAHVSGVIEADEIRLGSRVGGRVARVLVEEGETVQSGDVLVELEPFDLLEREARLEFALAAREAELARFVTGFREEEKLQAKAKLDQLQARFDLLTQGPRKEEIEAARGRLVLAETAKRLAEQTFERQSKLARNNAVSTQEH
ncbi:HlyD family secretion protein [Novipirellula sp.]|uniref:HlyD family secretion protein n=1 Tax=Novipirellula sp. TaxID=2795430 RepID=UPI0035681D4D